MGETERLTLREVADLTGLPLDSIRKRVYRGTLAAEKIDGQYKVLPIDALRLAPPSAEPAAPVGETQDRTGIRQGETPPERDQTDLIAAKDQTIIAQNSEIEFLRSLVEQLRSDQAVERERFDVIHREALHRIESLTAGMMPTNEPDTVEPATMMHVEPPEAPETTEAIHATTDTLHERSRFSDLWRRVRGRSV